MVNQQQRSSGQTPVNLQKSRSQTPADEMVNQQKSRSQTPVYEKSVDQTSTEEITSTSLRFSESSQRMSGQENSSIFRLNQDLEGSHETSSFSNITQRTVSESSMLNSRVVSETSQDSKNYRSPANAPDIQELRERYGNIRLPAKYQNIDKRERREEREISSTTSLRHDDGIDTVLTYYYFQSNIEFFSDFTSFTDIQVWKTRLSETERKYVQLQKRYQEISNRLEINF